MKKELSSLFPVTMTLILWEREKKCWCGAQPVWTHLHLPTSGHRLRVECGRCIHWKLLTEQIWFVYSFLCLCGSRHRSLGFLIRNHVAVDLSHSYFQIYTDREFTEFQRQWLFVTWCLGKGSIRKRNSRLQYWNNGRHSRWKSTHRRILFKKGMCVS